MSTIGLAVGGTPAVIAQGSVALLGEVAAGDAAASSAGEQIQQAVAVAQSTCLTEDDCAKAATKNLILLPPVPDPPSESTRPTRSMTRLPPGIASDCDLNHKDGHQRLKASHETLESRFVEELGLLARDQDAKHEKIRTAWCPNVTELTRGCGRSSWHYRAITMVSTEITVRSTRL